MSTTVTAEKERQNFLYYLLGTLLTALPVAHLFFTMWTGGAHQFFLSIINIPIAQSGGESLQAVLMFAAGLFLSLLILFANDWRKRYQGYILIMGTALILVVLNVLGIGLATENIALSSILNLVSFASGVITGLMTELRRTEGSGGDLLNIDHRHPDSTWAHWVIPDRNRNRPAQFPTAYRFLVISIVAVVIAANAFNYIYNQNIAQVGFHAVASVGLLYSVYSLLDINSMTLAPSDESKAEPEKTQFEVLGPQQSGKTYLALGLNLTVRSNDQYDLEGLDGRMPDIVEEHANRITGKTSGLIEWGIGNTMIDAAEKVVIEFVRKNTKRGGLRSATISMYDYPGEVLEGLAEEYNEKRGKKMTDGGETPEESGDSSGSDKSQESSQDEADDSLGNIEDIIDDVDIEEPSATDSIEEKTPPSQKSNTDQNSDEQSVSKPDPSEEVELISDVQSSRDAENGNLIGSVDDKTPDDEPTTELNNVDDAEDADTDADDEGSDVTDSEDSAATTTEDPQSQGVQQTPDSASNMTNEDTAQVSQEPNNSGQSMSNISPDEIDKVKKALIQNVGSADKLVVLLDSQRFMTEGDIMQNDAGMMLKEMTQIVQGAGPDEIIPVATKADHFIEEYDELTTGTFPTEKELDEFSEFVHDKLDSHPMAGNLVELADYPVFPVYFLTGKGESGEPKLRVQDGHIHPIGYDELIDAVVSQ